jgi:hypothetical protein
MTMDVDANVEDEDRLSESTIETGWQAPLNQIRKEDRRHQKLVQLVQDCFQMSYDAVSQRYSKWEKADQMDRSYVDVGETDSKGKKKNPFDRTVFIPISRAIKDVLLTYYYQVFFGKRPYFQLDGRGPEDVTPAKRMEIVLDYQCERQRFSLIGYNFLNDILKYGYGNIKALFAREFKNTFRTVGQSQVFPFPHKTYERQPTQVLSYEGPHFLCSDPYMTFHDPRVPTSQLQSGQYVGWAYQRSGYYLKKMHQQGVYFNIEYLNTVGKETKLEQVQFGGNERWRTMGLGDQDLAHLQTGMPDKANPMYVIREIVIEIIPQKYGVSESRRPEKWIIATVNNQLLIRCERMPYDHDMFPNVAAEYDYDGYSLYNPGFYEGVEGLQDLLNWLYNSHIDNVRRFLNDQIVFDPSAVEVKDLLSPHPAKLIRLKKKLYEQNIPISSVIQQLQVSDVTQSHLKDADLISDLIQRKAHAPDNMQGVETTIKRTATEIAKMNTASSTILQTQGQVIYSQAMVPLAEMLVMLNQQLLSEPRYYRIIGDYSKEIIQPDPRFMGGDAIFVGPEEIQGYFDFPVQDGTLPMRAQDNVQNWIQILELAQQIPTLGQRLDLWWVFKQAAQGMGVKNIEDAEIQMPGMVPGIPGGIPPVANVNAQVLPDEQIANMAQAGNVIPLPTGGV